MDRVRNWRVKMFERRARADIRRESRRAIRGTPSAGMGHPSGRDRLATSTPSVATSRLASSRRLPRVRRDGYRRGHVHVERSNAPPADSPRSVQRGQHVRVHPLPFASEHVAERRLRRPFEIVQRHRPLVCSKPTSAYPSRRRRLRQRRARRSAPVEREATFGGDADAGEISARDDARIRQRERLRAEHLARSRQTRQVRNLIHQ